MIELASIPFVKLPTWWSTNQCRETVRIAAGDGPRDDMPSVISATALIRVLQPRASDLLLLAFFVALYSHAVRDVHRTMSADEDASVFANNRESNQSYSLEFSLLTKDATAMPMPAFAETASVPAFVETASDDKTAGFLENSNDAAGPESPEFPVFWQEPAPPKFDSHGVDPASYADAGVGFFSPSSRSSRSKPLTRTSSAIDGYENDDGYTADNDIDDEVMHPEPARGEHPHPLKQLKRTTKRNIPNSWREQYRQAMTTYCVNNAPQDTGCDGTLSTCANDGCSNAAAVWCHTCERTLCRECDMVDHSGMICNPAPHMREIASTGVELGPKEAAPTEDGLAAIIDNVYLVCSAVCQKCGQRNWKPSKENRKVGLTVVTTDGRFNIDRTSYTCRVCDNVAGAGDPMTYLTKTTIPATLGGDTQTIFTHQIVSFLHRLQGKNPGVSADAMAGALSSPGKTVRPEHVRSVLGLLEDIDAGVAASVADNRGSAGMTEIAREAALLFEVRRSAGFDMSLKIKLKNSTTRKEAQREEQGGETEDNLCRKEVIPDSVMYNFRMLDPRQETSPDACDREFVAAKATNNGDAREGLVVGVDASGSPVIATIPLHGDGERYIYHLIALIAATLSGRFDYCTIDIACKFTSWLDRVGIKLRAVEVQLRLAASTARQAGAPFRRELSSAAVAGNTAADWLQPHLLAVAELFKRKNMTDGDACREAAAVMTALVFLLEVHGGMDVEITEPTEWPDLLPKDFVVVLDAMHAYAHGWGCRLEHDPRGLRDIGRQCGEQVERHNAIVLGYASRIASCGTEFGKMLVATSMRAEQDAKLNEAANAIRRSIMASRSLLDQLAIDFMHRSAGLGATTSIHAKDAERAARNALTLSATTANNAVDGTLAENARTWCTNPTTLTDTKIVEQGVLARIANGRQKKPQAKQMQALLAQCMVAKTETQLASVLEAIKRVTGEDSLATATAQLAMQNVTKLSLPSTAPEFAGQSDGTQAIDTLKKELRAIGMPETIIEAGFPPGGVKAIDSTTLCSWIAIRMSMDEAGTYAAAIRERKLAVYGPCGDHSGVHRARGGAGAQRRVVAYKCVKSRLKKRSSQLWAWVNKHNFLVKGLQESVDAWTTRSSRSSGYPALHLDAHDLPEVMTEANVRDPGWIPAHNGLSKSSVADTAFVDALRAWLTHFEEATHVGSGNAKALLSVLAKTHSRIAARINDGLNPVLGALLVKSAPQLTVALTGQDHLFAVARHCQRSMLTPQVLLSGLIGQEGRASADTAVNPNEISDVLVRCLLAGWRAKLLQQLQRVSLLWSRALVTLKDVIPAALAAQAEPAAHTETPTVLPGAPSTVDSTLERAPSSMSSSAPPEDAVQHGSCGTQAAPSSQLQVQLRTLQASGEPSDSSSSGDASTSDGAR